MTSMLYGIRFLSQPFSLTVSILNFNITSFCSRHYEFCDNNNYKSFETRQRSFISFFYHQLTVCDGFIFFLKILKPMHSIGTSVLFNAMNLLEHSRTSVFVLENCCFDSFHVVCFRLANENVVHVTSPSQWLAS